MDADEQLQQPLRESDTHTGEPWARPMPRLTGIEGQMRLVVFVLWLLLQVF